MALTYAGYLELEKILNAQHPQSEPPEHDEMLFIIIHQTYELWFKQLVHEFDKVAGDFDEGRLFEALGTLRRCREILKTLVGQVDILETMTPTEFESFRDRLDTASGFQSVQFRIFEYQLGYKRKAMLEHLDPSWYGYDEAVRRLEVPSLYDHFYRFLVTQGVAVPQRLLERDVTQPVAPDEELQQSLLAAYRERPELVLVIEAMCDIDEGQQEWRYRHVKLVERTIGHKTGTGGSLGVEFLKKSLFKPVFPDLWEIRRYF